MTGDYPRFRMSYSHDELVEYFLLTPTEQDLIAQCRGDVNRHGVAVLLKSLHYLGSFPESPPKVPPDVKTFLARQLHLLWDPSAPYPTDERTQRYHLAWIRQYTGWRAPTANQRYTYDELLYVRKHYVSVEALRQANATVVNKILALRAPRLWGEGHAWASDGTRVESWRQNRMTEWRSRYKGYGVLVYWHVETKAVALYSQLRNFSFSEVAAMIEGLIRHDTEMRVEKNFVDSHGQSEVAFAFCHLLGGVRLMPRLKRLTYERLYLPGPGMAGAFPNLAGVLSRPIRWDLIVQQYDEMVKHAVALKTGTATAEAILKRFNSYNVTHPTYKALAELGKVEKTIYLCEYLSSLDLRYEVNEGLNVVERWHAASDFLCYGRQGIWATNSREQQEVTTLALQLLQNCLMLINTVLLQHTIAQHHLHAQLGEEDYRALTPFFYEHVNPYGLFALDLEQPSFLEAA